MSQAPEGIVLYSWSGALPVSFRGQEALINNLITNGQIGKVGENAYIDYRYIYNTAEPYLSYTSGTVLSKSYIETIDLLSEGKIKGLVSGEYVYSGNFGQTGWSTAVFSGYQIPTGVDINGNPYTNAGYLRSIYYNEVPILSDKGQFNFQSTEIAFTPGLPNGDNLETLTSEETTSRGIGERLRGGDENSKIYRILNPNCKGIIVNVKVPSLSITSASDGSLGRTRISYNIYYRPLFDNLLNQSDFSSPINENIFGKITSAGAYIRSTRIDFNVNTFFSKQIVALNNDPLNLQTKTIISTNNIGNFLDNENFIGWEIKIVRITDDSISALLTNPSFVDSITELYGNSFSYPNSAIVKNLFDAEFFSAVPARAFESECLEVLIPGNYDPILKTYSTSGVSTTNGYWDGTFAPVKQYTNNPAWCFYDMLNNTRYGLGKYVDDINIDKFTLYNIGQYCDQLVYNGEGGLEPRFTCNTWIAGRNDAFNVINDLASVFRGMIYYAQGNIYSICDSPKDPRTTFTNANVENGDFNYSSTSKRTRQSVAIVSYNNPQNFYKPEIEYVEDIDSIRKYGIREIDLTAFACTSRGQAIRLARWTLLTNNFENETITFSAGLEANTLRPGDLFKVHDTNRKLKRYGGRVWNTTNSGYGDVITLDSTVPIESGIEYKLSILTPSYTYDTTQETDLNAGDYINERRSFLQDFIFSGQSGYNYNNKTIINLNTGLNRTDYNISGYPVWSIELAPNSVNYTGARYFINSDSDYYRVLNLKENDINKYEVVGLKYYGQKFIEIDSGINFQRPSISLQTRTPADPSNLSLNLYNQNGQDIIRYTFLVNNYNYINNYKVYATTGAFTNSIPDNQYLVSTLPVDIIQGNYYPLNSGNYNFRIYSYNNTDNIFSNNYTSSSIIVNKDLWIRNVMISSLQTDI